MNKLKLFLSVVLICWMIPSSAQIWMKNYGDVGEDYAYAIEKTPEGGFVIGGMTTSNLNNGDRDYWVAKFDSAGNKLWDHHYGAVDTPETLWSISVTRDSGYLIAGFSGVQYSGTESALMYKIDKTGKVVWKDDINYSNADHAHFLVERKTTGYYMGGHTDSKGVSSGEYWLVKLDEDRKVIWEKVFTLNGGEHVHAGRETTDGGAILIGHTTNNYGQEKYMLIKVDSNGNKQWRKVYNGKDPNFSDSPYYIELTKDGGYVMFGGTTYSNTASDMWLFAVDSIGTPVVDKHFGGAGYASFAWSGRQTSDGGFMLIGYTNDSTHYFGDYDFYAVKTDTKGNLVAEKRYGGSNYDFGYGVVEMSPGQFVFAGLTYSFGQNGDLLLVKADSFNKTSGIEEPIRDKFLSSYRVYPNPSLSGSELKIDINLEVSTRVNFEIYNSLGQDVCSIKNSVNLNPGKHIFSWNGLDYSGNKLKSGLYHVILTTNGGVTSRTISIY